MKKYEELEMIAVRFDAEDVIATSGTSCDPDKVTECTDICDCNKQGR